MASQMVCRCGLRYQLRGVKAESKPRCPVCGSNLKVPTGSSADRGSGRPDWAWLKIGIGVSSAVGLIALIIVIRYVGIAPVINRPRPAQSAPVAAAPSTSTANPTNSIGILDRQMVPIGPIGLR
ncbi:MAG: hypothetical protein JWN86_2973 [Planctomycetota bacterium]|nr:hypothetical protein [Planctomycetota bacterium]